MARRAASCRGSLPTQLSDGSSGPSPGRSDLPLVRAGEPIGGPKAAPAGRPGARVAHAGVHPQAHRLTVRVVPAGAGEERQGRLESADLPEERDNRRSTSASHVTLIAATRSKGALSVVLTVGAGATLLLFTHSIPGSKPIEPIGIVANLHRIGKFYVNQGN